MESAIILAAGRGNRLRPLSDDIPKPLTEVNGKPILCNMIRQLSNCGIKEAIIVVGYLPDVIKESLGSSQGEMKICYVEAHDYDKTNNMYSLWLARDYLGKGVLILEADCFYEDEVMKRFLGEKDDKSYWLVDRFTEDMDGCMSTSDSKGRIIELQIVREKLKEYKDNYYKSCGAVKVQPEYGSQLSEWLDADVKNGNVGIYYDLVLAKHLQDLPLYVYSIEGLKWYEIDDFADLKKAELLFRGD